MLVAVLDVRHQLANKQIPLSGLIRKPTYELIEPAFARNDAGIKQSLMPNSHVLFVVRRHDHLYFFDTPPIWFDGLP